jgi:cytidine deaminase
MTNDHLPALFAAARDAAANAYAPYSKFPVGAAVLDADGSIHRGCNVENASSGLTICAERNAVAAAIAAGAKKIAAIAIFTPTETFTTPCGACRQVLAEFADDSLPIHLIDNASAQQTHTLASLFPHPFRLDP